MNILSCKASNLTTPELSASQICRNVVNGCDALRKKHLIREKLRKVSVDYPSTSSLLSMYEFMNSYIVNWFGYKIFLLF